MISHADEVQINNLAAQDNFEDFKTESESYKDSTWSHYTKWSTVQSKVERTMIIRIDKLSINLEVKIKFVRKFVLFICLSVAQSACHVGQRCTSICLSTINQSINQSISQSIRQSFHQAINL